MGDFTQWYLYLVAINNKYIFIMFRVVIVWTEEEPGQPGNSMKESWKKGTGIWKYGVTDTVPTRTGYYEYNDTKEVVVELTPILL